MAVSKLENLRHCFHRPHHLRFFSQLTPRTTMAAATWTAGAGHPPRVSLSCALQAAVDARDLGLGKSIHALLMKAPTRSVSLWNMLLGLYTRCGQTQSAKHLFDGMRVRNAVSFNTVICACLRSAGDRCGLVGALELYSMMRGEGLKPNNITLSVFLAVSGGSAASLGLMEQIHAQSVKLELDLDGFVGSALVSGYTKRRRLEEAIRAFDRIAEVDAVAWNVLIDSCACSGSTENTAEVFSRMRSEGGQNASFNGFTLTSVLKTCLEPKYLRLGMQLHSCAMKAGFALEIAVCNALITMYSKCQKDKGPMVSVFQAIPDPNIISWTAMVSGFMQNELNEEAVILYKEMLRVGFVENEFCFASVLPAFSGLANLQNGRQIHGRIVKSVFGLDVAVGNALIDMYFKCGSLEDAQLVFKTMKKYDVVSWTVLITGLGQHGKAREAVDILKEMVDRGYKPDSVTFLAGLSACSHGGLVDEGFQVFHAMNSIYHIKPKKEHYASVIDLLGRAGKLEEAERCIIEMGLDSDSLAWETLLAACRIHGEVYLAERSAKKVLELEPQKEGPYVMLSNIYAEKRMWEEKGVLRHKLDVTGLKKEVGYSWPMALET